MNENILRLLGLALRGGRLAVGEEPTALAALGGKARLVMTASDAAGNTLRRAEHLAEEGHCLCLQLPFTKAELGGALGRGSAAVAALTDTGLAAAVTERLAGLDPERYGEAAARMELKLRRAKERRTAPRREKKDPPPRREDRRPPPQGRKSGGPGYKERSPDGKPRQGGRPGGRGGGKGRPYGEKGDRRPHSGKPGRPHGEGSAGPRNAKRPSRPPKSRGGPGGGGR